jgi:8-oxo-dGTP pyrophosphatase MutT (NUDIX family)
MVRPSQLLHAQREPAVPRPAATVLLLRDGAQGLEVLMTRRSATASFAPGAYVFPGGTIDAADAQSHGLAGGGAGQDDAHLTQAIAAIRESFEELGVALLRRADGSALATRMSPRWIGSGRWWTNAGPAGWCWRPTRSGGWPTGSPTATCRAAST